MKKAIFTFTGLFCAIMTIHCGKDTVAGTGTLIGNPTVAGVLYNADGSFAKNAIVHIRKKNALADIPAALAKKLTATTVTVTTDNKGQFTVDSIDTGLYVIEGTDGRNNLSLNDSVPVKNPDSTVIVPPDTLKPAGAIKGVIQLSEGGDPRKAFILAFGIDRFIGVQSDGSFKFTDLAEGSYDLRIISSLDNYGVLDTMDIPVKSADTTNLDTIDLPFIGIPTPRNVSLSYDTVKQIVTLHWNGLENSLFKSVNIYRRNVDSNTVLTQINTSPIVDTIFHDSTVVDEQTYGYRIAAVDKNEMEGIKSVEVTVRIGLYVIPQNVRFFYDTLKHFVKLNWNNPDTARVESYNIYRRDLSGGWNEDSPLNATPLKETTFIDSSAMQDETYEYRVAAVIKKAREGVKSPGIRVFIASNFLLDTIFNYGTWTPPLIEPKDIAIATNGDVYIPDIHDSSLSVFDSTMHFKNKVVSNIPIDRIRIVENKCFAASGGSIFIFDSTGRLLDTITIGRSIIDFDAKGGLLYVITELETVSIYSYDGILKGSWDCQNAIHITKGDSNKIYVSNRRSFYQITIFDTTGVEISIFKLPYDPASLQVDLMKDLFYDDVGKRLFIVTMNKNSIYNTLYVFNKNDILIARYDFFVAFFENVSVGIKNNGTVFILLNPSRRIYKLKPLF